MAMTCGSEIGGFWALPPVLAWCIALCWTDCRKRLLPNRLTIGGALVALAWRFGYGMTPGLISGFAAAAIAAAFLLFPYLMRGAGAGDVKMLFGAGAIVGWSGCFSLLWVTSIAGFVFGLLMLLFGKLDPARLKHFFRSTFDWRYDREAGAAALPPKDSERLRIPFSIPISVGLLVTLIR